MREQVGPYRVTATLGRGGMGVVYRGLHEKLGREVAIKALAPELTQNSQFRDRFFSEARTQAQLHHPNIVTIYDLLDDGDEYFIVMEFVEGKGLDEILAERGALPEGEALRIFSQVLSALDGAHVKGVIHRDIKSSNVLVESDSHRVKLMDFGIALLIGDVRLTQSSQTIGTPIYMSPEQILRAREVDHRTDIYSAGVLFFEMLAGRPPFDAETEYEIKKQHIETTPPDVHELANRVNPGISRAISRALSKSPEDRFASAGEFLRALQPAAGSTATSAPLTGAPTPEVRITAKLPVQSAALAEPPEIRSRRPYLAVAGGGAVLLALVLAVILFAGKRQPEASAPQPAAALVQPPAQARPPEPLPPSAGRTAAAVPTAIHKPAEAPTEVKPAPAGKQEPASPPSTPRPTRNVEQEIRTKTLQAVRTQVRAGIGEVEAEIATGSFDQARSRIKDLVNLTGPFRSDLVDEVVKLRLLDNRVTDALVAARTKQGEEAQQRAGWERRIGEIAELLEAKKFPEAKGLAKNLETAEGIPADILEQARALRQRADEGLKALFANTEIEGGEVSIQNETKRDKRRREKNNADNDR